MIPVMMTVLTYSASRHKTLDTGKFTGSSYILQQPVPSLAATTAPSPLMLYCKTRPEKRSVKEGRK